MSVSEGRFWMALAVEDAPARDGQPVVTAGADPRHARKVGGRPRLHLDRLGGEVGS